MRAHDGEECQVSRVRDWTASVCSSVICRKRCVVWYEGILSVVWTSGFFAVLASASRVTSSGIRVHNGTCDNYLTGNMAGNLLFTFVTVDTIYQRAALSVLDRRASDRISFRSREGGE
jgi:hypothetical protein